MTLAENMAQLSQLQGLKAAHARLLEVYRMMVPVVERLASEGDPLAKVPNRRARQSAGRLEVGEYGRPHLPGRKRRERRAPHSSLPAQSN